MRGRSVLVVGHGSRDPEANAEFERIVAGFRAGHPGRDVSVGYIELARPLLADALFALAEHTQRIALAPAFLFTAGHVKNDVPLAVRAARERFPGLDIAVAPAFGVHPDLAALAYDRASTAISADPNVRARTLLLVVGRGSSDPDANGDFCKMTRLIAEGRGLMHAEPTFLGITQPSVEASLELAARMRPAHLVVVPYLLCGGRLIARLTRLVQAFAARHPWIRTSLVPHLGEDPRLFALLEERIENAVSGRGVSPCDGCQYRTPLPGLENQVGGLRALLYSVRHTLTHAQATMPAHAHKPLKKHVFVCGNVDCAERGSVAVLDALRREVKAAGIAREVKLTRTACMGRCGEGPTVVVYPDGIFYRGVKEEHALELVREHIVHDRLVGRLVDDILH